MPFKNQNRIKSQVEYCFFHNEGTFLFNK